MEEETSEIVLFFGRFHPLILHLPVGFLTIAFVLEILSRFRRFKHFAPSVGFILLVGAVSAVVASILGLMLAQSGGYEDGLLSIHQWSGIAVSLMSFAAFALHWRSKRRSSVRWDKAYLAVMVLMVCALALAGHFGGSLTHGSDYLTRYMPNGLRKIAGLPVQEKKPRKKIANLNEAVVYADIIDPILDTYCTSCHNESKRKGDLMMHTSVALMKGGEGGPILIPGNAAKSQMIERMLLPEDDEDHMPPEGKRQPTEEEVDLLVWWVNEGAAFDKRVAEVNIPDDVQLILNTLVDSSANKSEVEILLSSTIVPAPAQTLSALQIPGVMIKPLSDEIHWLQADVAPNVPGDSLVQAFMQVSGQLTWLNLAGTSTTDDALPSVANFKFLTRLHLGNTAITDEGLKHLSDLPYLETLNLYGTLVTDEGIQYLAGLKNLKKLYVWQTKVTQAGAERLQESIPGLVVNMGLEMSGK